MIKNIKKYRFVSLMSLASFLFVAGGFFWAYGVLGGAEIVKTEPLILHFDDLNGITAVGGVSNLALVGILGIVIVAINFFVSLELEARDAVIGKIVVSITLVMAVLLFLSFVAILNVN